LAQDIRASMMYIQIALVLSWLSACWGAQSLVCAESPQTQVFELRDWIVDYQRPTSGPRVAPFSIPDDAKVEAMLANNSFPGPTLRVCVGDQLAVTVVNQLLGEQLRVAFPGMQILTSPKMPIAQQGGIGTYKMIAHKAGTFIWSAEEASQAAAGLRGAMVVQERLPPVTSLYQDELVISLADARQDAAVCISHEQTILPGCAEIEKATFNGQWGDGSSGWPWPRLAVTHGRCYLLRILALAPGTHSFEMRIQGHVFQPVVNDGPVDSIAVTGLTTSNVVLCADQPLPASDFEISFDYRGPAQTRRFKALLTYITPSPTAPLQESAPAEFV